MMTLLIYLGIAAYQLDWVWILDFTSWEPIYRALSPVLTFCFIGIDKALFELWRMYR